MCINIEKCPQCCGNIIAKIGQSVQHNELWWFRSRRCERCTYAVEEDGSGLDNDIRNEMLRTEGEWALLVDSPEDRTRALIATRRLLIFEMVEILNLRLINVNCVARGTRIEMEWLQQHLENEGIETHVKTNSMLDHIPPPS